MVKTINTKPAMFWNSVNGQTKKSQDANSVFPTNSGTHIQLNGDALVSGGVRVPGGGMMSASVFKAENFSALNPVMLVTGLDVDGQPFEKEININNVDPRNASFIEMFALDGYFAANGKPSSTTRAAAAAMIAQGGLDIAKNNAFTQFDFVTPLLAHLETQRSVKNWGAVAWLTPIVDTLMNHISQR